MAAPTEKVSVGNKAEKWRDKTIVHVVEDHDKVRNMFRLQLLLSLLLKYVKYPKPWCGLFQTIISYFCLVLRRGYSL